MKKAVSMLCMVMAVLFVKAQDKAVPVEPYKVPVDSVTGKITYEGIVEVKGFAAGELYQRINAWFQSYYKNPTEVIRENDSINNKMVGKPRFRLSNQPDKNGVKTDGGVTQYTITVAAKDGRYKYEITDVNWKQISVFPSERWMDTKSSSYSPAYNDYLQQLDKTALEVIAALKKAVTEAKAVKDKDAW